MNHIKELRIQCNLTQQQLAYQLGMNQTVVGKYEREELEPNINTLIKLADIFNCSIDYLVGREDDFGNIVLGESVPKLTKEETALLVEFRKLSELKQYQVIGYINALT